MTGVLQLNGDGSECCLRVKVRVSCVFGGGKRKAGTSWHHRQRWGELFRACAHFSTPRVFVVVAHHHHHLPSRPKLLYSPGCRPHRRRQGGVWRQDEKGGGWGGRYYQYQTDLSSSWATLHRAPNRHTERERERHSELSLRQCWLDLALHQLKELTPLVPNQHKYPPTQRHIQLNTPLWLKISNPGPPLYPSIRTNTCPYFHPPPLYFVVLLSLSQNVPPLSCSPSPKAPLFSFILHTHMHIIHIYIYMNTAHKHSQLYAS